MTKLESLVDRLLTVADRRNLARENPITIMIDVGTEQFYTVVSYNEPNHVTLPMNVTWVVADPESPLYAKALRRASALPNQGFRNTWAELRTYQDFTDEPQFWDLSATFQFGEVQVTGVKEATETMRGIFKLNREPADDSDPLVVSSDDPRMSNSRQPLPHEHPLLPSTMLEGSTGINEFYVKISDSQSPRTGEALFLTGQATSLNDQGEQETYWEGIWRKVESSDLIYDGPVVQELVINGPVGGTLDETAPFPFTVDAVFDDGTTLSSVAASWEIIANRSAATISASTGMFTSNDISGDQVVRIRATWTHAESGEQHSTTFDLTVIDNTVTAVLERIEISGSDTLEEGGRTSAYTVTAFYDDGSSRGVTPTTFTSSNAAAGSLNSATGIFTSSVDVMNNQTTTLSASYTEAGVTRSATFDMTVLDVTVYPQSAVVEGPLVVDEGTEATYVLNVTFTDLTTSQVAVSDWGISNPAAGVIGSATGEFVAVPDIDSNETARISASYTSNGRTVTAHLDITVRDADVYPVSAIITGPNQVEENTAATYQMLVTFTDDTETVVVVDDWASSNPAAGTIGADSGEFVAAEDVSENQPTTISASFTQSERMVTATRDITVLDVTNYPVSASIIGNNTQGEGKWQDLQLEITYQDATKRIVVAQWSSSDSVLLPVNANGRATAQSGLLADASATITARYSEAGVDLEDTLAITVTDDTLYPTEARIVGPETVNENTTVTYTLEVTFQGGEKRIEPVSTFAVSDSAMGTITNDGRLTAPSNVTSDVSGTITASYTLDGVTVNASLPVTVTDDTVYPASARILGPTLIDEDTVHSYQFEVTFTDASVRVVSITDWASSNTSVATIGASSGQLTSLSLNADSNTNISGSYTAFGVTVTASVNVVVEDTTNYPVSAVVQGPASVDENTAAVQYQLLVTFNDSSEQVMPATWSSTNSNAGTLSSSTGTFQPRANVIGDVTTTIKGTYSAFGVTVDADMTVTVKDTTAYPVRATVNGPFTVDEEQSASYTLQVEFDNGDVLDVPAEDWASSNPDAGTIESDTGNFVAATNNTRNNIITSITASWTVDGVTVGDSRTVGVVDTSIYVEYVEIVGPSAIDESAEQQYEFRVTYADGTTRMVTAYGWEVNNTSIAYVEAATGVLTVSDNITTTRTVTLSASYDDENGITHGDSRVITLRDTIWRPSSLQINGPEAVLEGGIAQYTALVTYDNGNTATVPVTDWAFSPSEFGAFSGNELTTSEVTVDETGTITCSYTENGATAYGTKTITVENIYPTTASIKGPASVIGGESATYSMSVSRSDGSEVVEVVDTWEIVAQFDVDNNPIVIPATLDSSGVLTTESVPVGEQVEFQIAASYTESGVTLTETLDVVVTPVPDALPPMPRWGYAPYAGPTLTETSAGSPQAFIEGLTIELPSQDSGQTFTYNLPDGQTFAYFAHPKSMGNATFTDMANNFAGAWDGATWLDDYSNLDAKGPVEVMFDSGNGPEPWYVYRTDWQGPSAQDTTFRVDFDGV